MRQAIHILRKDIRHLWIEIAVVLAANGLFVLSHTSQTFWQSKAQLPQTVASFFVSFLLPVSWWVLIVRAIHGETLVGDREFWSTRPYDWKSLLAAKLLFLATFVNLPIFAAQAAILQSRGFPMGAEMASLLWNQVLLTTALFLPVAAVATLTTGIVQFLIIGLVAFALTLVVSLRLSVFAATVVGGAFGPMDWITSSYELMVLTAGAFLILIWQYARRRTLSVRIAGAAIVIVTGLGAPLSWTQAFEIQSHVRRSTADLSGVRAGLNTHIQWMTRALVQKNGTVTLSIPLEVSGVPDGLSPKAQGLTFSMESPDGAVWQTRHVPPANFNANGQLIMLQTSVEEPFHRRVRDQPLTVRGYLYLALYGNRQETKVPFNGPALSVPGMGLCKATGGPPATYFLNCVAALRPRADLISIAFEPHPRVVADHRYRAIPSYSPFPAELSIDPLQPSEAFSTYQGPLDAVTVSSEEPVAFVRAPLLIEGLRLDTYETKAK
jgi:hypothetical protein